MSTPSAAHGHFAWHRGDLLKFAATREKQVSQRMPKEFLFLQYFARIHDSLRNLDGRIE
ncbi:hypothetical protein P7F60_04575 [Rhizobium sp. YJ-22]|uniref:hypothetical protein n=1 Tax=Rhizobium sp. YJ-22 TaxID=3037556 RepID=UPI001ACC94A0|nr:hypothetical protein [Rhizobium sp. YJ-22]MBN9033932.1 hypothetical protein [Hyphomicrobiales bacterium]MDG3575651.1 hypothetical protein [Rhizobium sp. YJ-22]